jgi:hypothetical protein
MTLTDLRESVPLNIPELARAAGVDAQTIRNAESGQRISVKSATGVIPNFLLKSLSKPTRTERKRERKWISFLK